MADSYGDGWNGNTWHWIDASGTSTTGTLSSGSYGTAQLCVYDSSCYTFYVDSSGNWTSEVSWIVTDSAGSTLASGGANSTTHSTCDNGVGVSVCTLPPLLLSHLTLTQTDTSTVPFLRPESGSRPSHCKRLVLVLVRLCWYRNPFCKSLTFPHNITHTLADESIAHSM